MKRSDYEILSLGEYQRSVQRFEKFNDGLVLPDMRLIVRIDGRRYGKWADEIDYPYDEGFVRALVFTASKVMCCGFRVQWALIHGDEISLIFDPIEGINPRRRSQILSLICSAASLEFSKAFTHEIIFHGVLSELPTDRHVMDYLFWQRMCFTRNLLSQALSRIFLPQGLSQREIADKVAKLTLNQRVELAVSQGYPYFSEPLWKRFGSAVWWDNSVSGSDSTASQVACYSLPETEEEFFDFAMARSKGSSFVTTAVNCLERETWKDAGSQDSTDALPSGGSQGRFRIGPTRKRLGGTAKPRVSTGSRANTMVISYKNRNVSGES